MGTKEVLGDREATWWFKKEVDARFESYQTDNPVLAVHRLVGSQPD
jgi:hypothetical protein